MLTRSTIEQWDLTHVVDAARAWNQTASKWTESFEYLHRASFTAGGDDWSGNAAEAMQSATARHALAAANSAVTLQDAARIADQGAADMSYARQAALTAIADAESQGYVVSDGLSVSDGTTTLDPMSAAARQSVAREHEVTVRYHAAVLQAADAETATKLGGIELTSFDTPLSPPPPPPAPDPVDQFYRGIAAGSNEKAALVPCPAPPVEQPSNWEKLTTPAPGVSESDLADKWAMYLGAAGTFGATITTDPLVGVFAAALLKPTFDDLLKAYGIGGE